VTSLVTRRIRIQCAALFLAGVVQVTPGTALAQKTQPKRPATSRVVTVSEVTIVGRVQRPIAAVDVSRIPPRLTLNERKPQLLSKLKGALYRAPF